MESRNKFTMCRLCLSENQCFINIFEFNDWQGYNASEVIYNLFHFQVSETDGYTHVVCSTCLVKLTEFKLFKERCQKSRVKYDEMFVSSESVEEHKPETTICGAGSGLELHDQDPLTETSSYTMIKQEELDIDSSGDESEYPFEGTNSEVCFGPIPLKHEVLPFHKDSHPELTLVDRVAHPQYVQCLQHKRPHCTVKGAVDSYAFTRNMSADDAPLLEKSKNITLSVEASSSGTMEEGQWIIPEERMFTVPLPQWDMGIRKDGVKDGDDAGGEGEGCTSTEKGVEGETARFKCYHCGNLLKTKRDLIRHMTVHGFGNSYDCEVCGKIFKSKSELKRHVFTHSATKVYKCAECSKCFRRMDYLKLHMRTHTGLKPYKCAECSKSFSRNSYLNKHMTIHTGAKPYTCTECQKGFSLNSYLKRHMNSHAGAKPYKCAECSRSFRDNSLLKVHMRSHTGCRPYKCSICSKSFGRNSILKIHLRSHMGFKPYKCAECSKSFSQNSDLNRHMRTHTGSKPYRCTECSKCFSQNSDLNRHMRIHTGSKPYECIECNKCFSKNDTLKIHMRTHEF